MRALRAAHGAHRARGPTPPDAPPTRGPAHASQGHWRMAVSVPQNFNPFERVTMTMGAGSHMVITQVGDATTVDFVPVPGLKTVTFRAAHTSTGAAAGGTILVDGTGAWVIGSGEPRDTPTFECNGVFETADAGCKQLGIGLTVSNLWATGYLAHVSIDRWQMGAGIDLRLGRSEVNGAAGGRCVPREAAPHAMSSTHTHTHRPTALHNPPAPPPRRGPRRYGPRPRPPTPNPDVRSALAPPSSAHTSTTPGAGTRATCTSRRSS